MKLPFFTIFIPSFNGGAYLKQSVASVLSQSYHDWQLFVLDDGSTDDSVSWLRSLKEPRLRVLESSHIGIEANWRRSLETEKAPWMTFLGQDDVLDAHFLETIARLITQNPDADIFHAHFRFIDESGKSIRNCRSMPPVESAADYIAALFSNARDTYGTGYILRSDKYDALGGIKPWERLLFADDALWISMMHGSQKITSPQQCFACRLHHKSASGAPPWRAWANAMNPYISFLNELAVCDENIKRAIEAHAPAYFLQWCRNVYSLALMQATKHNQSVDKDALNILEARLEKVQMGLGAQLRASRNVRLREKINGNLALRKFYRCYIRARYGKSHWETS